jgi:hypothetical protein
VAGEILLRLNEMSVMTSDRQIKLLRQTYSGLFAAKFFHGESSKNLKLLRGKRTRCDVEKKILFFLSVFFPTRWGKKRLFAMPFSLPFSFRGRRKVKLFDIGFKRVSINPFFAWDKNRGEVIFYFFFSEKRKEILLTHPLIKTVW